MGSPEPAAVRACACANAGYQARAVEFAILDRQRQQLEIVAFVVHVGGFD